MITAREEPPEGGWRIFGLAILIAVSAIGLLIANAGIGILIALFGFGVLVALVMAVAVWVQNLSSELITSTEKPAKRVRRVLAFALVFSALIHPLLIVLGLLLFRISLPNLTPDAAKRPPPKDEVVTISSAQRHAKRAVAAAGSPHRAARSAQPQPKVAQVQPHPEVLPRPPVPPVKPEKVQPTPQPTARPKVEIAKTVPHAPPVPQPTAKPNDAKVAKRTEKQPERVAYAPPQTAQRPSRFTPQQIAQIESDLARSIAQDRRASTLSNATPPPAAASMKRYAIDFAGINAKFGGAQGICHAIRPEWHVGDLVYMYDECRVQHANGSTSDEILPWPVHYHVKDAYYDENSGLYEGWPGSEVPWPDPDWRPTPGKYIDPDIIAALRERGYRI